MFTHQLQGLVALKPSPWGFALNVQSSWLKNHQVLLKKWKWKIISIIQVLNMLWKTCSNEIGVLIFSYFEWLSIRLHALTIWASFCPSVLSFIMLELVSLIRADQHGGWQVNWKSTEIWTFQNVLSQLFLKYAYTLDILIHQSVHMKFSDGTLPILLNFWKTIFSINLI